MQEKVSPMAKSLFARITGYPFNLAEKVKEAFKPYEPPRLPDEVESELLKQGYKYDVITFYGATGFSNPNPHTHAILSSPDGHHVNAMNTPVVVQDKFEADAKAAYEKLGLPVPEVIPGSEGAACISWFVELERKYGGAHFPSHR